MASEWTFLDSGTPFTFFRLGHLIFEAKADILYVLSHSACSPVHISLGQYLGTCLSQSFYRSIRTYVCLFIFSRYIGMCRYSSLSLGHYLGTCLSHSFHKFIPTYVSISIFYRSIPRYASLFKY